MARMNLIRFLQLSCLGAALIAPPAPASDRQDLAQLQRVVENYVRREAAGLPGSISFTVAPLDQRLSQSL